MKSSSGLVLHAKRALKEKWVYALGAYGQKCNEDSIRWLLNLGGEPERFNRSIANQLKENIGNRVCDCYGLLEGYLWWNTKDDVPDYNSRNHEDDTANGAYGKAIEKGLLSSMPDVPGIVLHMDGHVGIYIGNGVFVECTAAVTGTRSGTIKDGVCTSGSKFVSWFKDVNIDYQASILQESNKFQKNGKMQQATPFRDSSEKSVPRLGPSPSPIKAETLLYTGSKLSPSPLNSTGTNTARSLNKRAKDVELERKRNKVNPLKTV